MVAAGTAPAGSTVVLFVEPPTLTFKAHRSFTLTPVSRSTVTAGKWKLRLPMASAAVRASFEPTGIANFEVMNFTAHRHVGEVLRGGERGSTRC
jgi:hypothetical protein